jgi:hypothetical protein
MFSEAARLTQKLEGGISRYFHEVSWTAEDAGFVYDYAPATDAEVRAKISEMLSNTP